MRRLKGNIIRLFTLVYPVPEEGTCGNWGGVLSVIFWELARITGWSEYEMLGFSKCSSRFEIRVRNVVWILSSICFNIYQILFWVTWLCRLSTTNRLRKDKEEDNSIVKVIVKDPIQACAHLQLTPMRRSNMPYKYKNNNRGRKSKVNNDTKTPFS